MNSKKNIIITSYYFNKPDPQRNKFYREDFNYIKQFYNSLINHNLDCIIFHDGLSDEFLKKYTTDKIRFIKFSHDDYKTSSGNDTRYLVYLDYLKDKNTDYDKIIISDISGIEFLENPFNQITDVNKIYVVRDRIKTKYGKKRDLTHYWFKDYAINAYGTFDLFEKFKYEYALCAGYFCGNYNLIMEILSEFKSEFDKVDLTKNTNYAVFNYIMYSKFRKIIIQGYSTHDGYEEKVLPDKEYVIKIRNANVWGKLYWDNK